ncbi:MAG: aldehyde dehydrogenase [Treponemataceae bacterium]|nr:aldehyde dehydrogenase [Treponemataceae bacterium]
MTKDEIQTIVKKQREFFNTGVTLDAKYRIAALKKLKAVMTRDIDEINAALKADLGKSAFESYMCESGLSLSELDYMIAHAKKFSKVRHVSTPLVHIHSTSRVQPSPYGVVLVMSPWNYPFLLTIDAMVDAIAAGNTVVVKPSAYSPASTGLICRIIAECFPPEYVTTISGGRAENTYLLDEHFDYIFFTGSKAVGKEVMRRAAEHLTPVTLELGGKSPCIIDEKVNIKLAAKRLVFGKLLNCGQTCVAPDYVYVHSSVKEKFVEAVKAQIVKQYGEKPLENPDFGKMINEKHFARVMGLINKDKVVFGGNTKPETLQIEPTVMVDVTFDDAVMQEEIFGPLMPIMTYDNLDDVIAKINSMESPLALYIFTDSSKTAKKVLRNCRFGGGCVNDTIVHLATSSMGFGGFGESGMGAYHGKTGFETFSHLKSILEKKNWIDMPMRYQPYKSFWGKVIKLFM